MRFWIFLSAILCAACGNQGDRFEKEAEWRCRKLTSLFSEIETIADFKERSSKIERETTRLIDAIIGLDAYFATHPNREITRFSAEKLHCEMERVSAIEGMVPLIEEVQRTGLHRLDAYHREKVAERGVIRRSLYDPLSGRGL